MRTDVTVLLATAMLTTAIGRPVIAEGPPVATLEWIGSAEIAKGAGEVAPPGEPVGGLSGLAWNVVDGTFWALADDPSERGPARAYRLRVDLADGRLDAGDVTVVGRVALARADGTAFPLYGLDPEGIAWVGERLFLSSEGDASAGLAPFVAEAGHDGRIRGELALPAACLPGPGPVGVRRNLGFESLTVSPDGRLLFAATENALAQDGPAADIDVASTARILVWRLAEPGAPPRELVYPVEAVRVASPPAEGAFRLNGLVDLLAISSTRLLALERQYVEGQGHAIRLYLVDLDGATDVTGRQSLAGAAAVPVHKELLADLGALGVPLGNVEGMAFGPTLPDGRRSLVLVADDNFDPAAPNQVLAFAVDGEVATIAGIQGAGHRSPLADRLVLDVSGVVTATIGTRRAQGFWMQSARPDDDPATSEGLWVEWPGAAERLAAGQAVRVHGWVRERAADARQLPLTTLVASAVVTVDAVDAVTPVLPPPVALVSEVPVPVTAIDDDALAAFEPASDALDFWESLEGMRVSLPAGTVIGPTTGYDELTLGVDGLLPPRRTASGALRVGPDGAPAVGIAISGRLATLPQLDVGARLAPLDGIVHYDFSRYKLVATAPVAASDAVAASCAGGVTRLVDAPGRLTVATFNVENLAAAGPPERFDRLGAVIAARMGAPALVALEEIQDDSGPADDGTVTSAGTLAALIAGVVAHGGPRYEAVWIDPEHNREGGQPGGNIRVALLVDPARATVVRRPGEAGGEASGPLAAARVVAGESGRPRLAPSPGRVAPGSPAFTLAGGEGVRRSLAVELEVAGRPLFVAVNHWSSKYDDDRAWGVRQPPVRPTAAKRLAQAAVLRAWTDELLAADPEARVIVLGDLNEGDAAPGVVHLAAPPLANLVAGMPDTDRYSYNFEGAAESIDHVVVSPSLAAGAEIEILHLDSDCAAERRVSDHDPVVARLPWH